MKVATACVLMLIGLLFIGCNNAEIGKVAPVKNDDKSENELEFKKDSLYDKTVSPTVNEPSKQVDFVKIPTH